MTKEKNISVAKYLSQQIAISGKSQVEIAKDVGYDKPNVITMIKQGKTKLPVNKVPLFAKSLGIDPAHMLRIVMSEYMPETWEVIVSIVGNSLISENEMRILQIVRDAAAGVDVVPANDASETELAKLVSTWKEEASASADAALRRVTLRRGTSETT